MKITVNITHSNRSTVRVEVKSNTSIEIDVPKDMSRDTVERFINEQRLFVDQRPGSVTTWRVELPTRKRAAKKSSSGFSERELDELKACAREAIPKRVAELALLLGVTYNDIRIKAQKTRWGSCSSKNNLNFNCLLMLCPDEVRDYVIIHELCHLKHLDHSKKFWAEVERYCPSYKAQDKWLTSEGSLLMRRLRNGR